MFPPEKSAEDRLSTSVKILHSMFTARWARKKSTETTVRLPVVLLSYSSEKKRERKARRMEISVAKESEPHAKSCLSESSLRLHQEKRKKGKRVMWSMQLGNLDCRRFKRRRASWSVDMGVLHHQVWQYSKKSKARKRNFRRKLRTSW